MISAEAHGSEHFQNVSWFIPGGGDCPEGLNPGDFLWLEQVVMCLWWPVSSKARVLFNKPSERQPAADGLEKDSSPLKACDARPTSTWFLLKCSYELVRHTCLQGEDDDPSSSSTVNTCISQRVGCLFMDLKRELGEGRLTVSFICQRKTAINKFSELLFLDFLVHLIKRSLWKQLHPLSCMCCHIWAIKYFTTRVQFSLVWHTL